MSSTGPRGWTRLVVGAALLVGVATACGGTGYRYVESRSNGAYFKIPEEWHLLGRDDILEPNSAAAKVIPFITAFDGAPQPSGEHDLDSDHPFGLAQVRLLTDAESDSFSLASLRNQLVKIDEIIDADESKVDLLAAPEAITLSDGTRGSRLVYTVHADTRSFSVDQTGLVDPTTRKVYFFIIGCEASCFQANRATITEIADSWTIKEP